MHKKYNEECIYNAVGVIKNNKISLPLSKLYIKTIFAIQPGWNAIIDKVVDKCMGNGSITPAAIMKKMSLSPYNLKECNPIYFYYTSCISVNFMIECPDNYSSKS